MKQTLIIVILLGALVLSACTTQKQEIPDGAVFQFETYGGFVPIEMAKQTIIIDKEKITYIVSSSDDKITETYQRKIVAEEYNYLLKLFNDKDFLGMDDKYSPPEVTVADVGDARLAVNFGNTSKIVTLESYFLEYYPDNVRLVFEAMQSYVNTIYDLPEEDLKALVEEWIRNAPTYKYDGSELEYVDMLVLESYPTQYVLKYNFKSAAGGYGDRSKMMNVQVITDHEILVTVYKGKVIGAIIDGKWDEVNQKNYEAELMFQPLQCAKTPWRKWYEAGNIQFIKAPSEEELVIAYYGQVHDVTIQNFKLVASNDVVAAVCGNVEAYYFTAAVSKVDEAKMLGLSWKNIEE